MPEISIRNKQIEDKDILWRRFFPPQGKEKDIPITYLTNNQIKEIFEEGTPYFATSKNKLVITLKESDTDTEEFVFFKGNNSKVVKDLDAQLYFKFTNNKKSNFERDDFLVPSKDKKGSVFNVTVSPSSDISSKTIALDVEQIKKALLKRFNELKVTVPKYGMLAISFSVYPKSKDIIKLNQELEKAKEQYNKLKKSGGIAGGSLFLTAIKKLNSADKKLEKALESLETYRILIKCSFDTPHIAQKTTQSEPKVSHGSIFGNLSEKIKDSIIEAAQNVSKQTGLELKPQFSDKANFISSPFIYDTFFVPQLSSSFVYNFYEPTEEDLSVYVDSKKYSNSKLKDIPKYIELSWNKPPLVASARLEDAEAQAARSNRLEISEGNSKGRYTKLADTVTFGGKRYSLNTKMDNVNSFNSSQSKTTSGGLIRSKLSAISREVKNNTGNSSVSPVSNARTQAGFDFINSLDESISLIESSEEERFSDKRDLLIKDNSINEIEKFMSNSDSLIKNINIPDAIAGLSEKSRYVGYVIVKERLVDLQSENFEPLETIVITNINKTSYLDTKIAYGEVYRYKIRSIYKFINNKNLPMFDDPDIILNENELKKNFRNTTLKNNAYFFDSKSSQEIEIAASDETRPDAPFGLRLFPDSKNKTVFITWNQKQQQKDVVGFNVYRKDNGGTFKKINQNLLPVRSNFYLDTNLEYNKEYIYAIQSFDLHDNPSKLSFQVLCSLRLQDFQDVTEENDLKVDVPYNLEFDENKPKDDRESINLHKKIKITINPLYGNLDRNVNYLLKFTSLDSFIEKEIKLNFKTKIIIHKSSDSNPESIKRAEALKKELQDKERQRFGYTEEEIRRLKPDTGFDNNGGR